MDYQATDAAAILHHHGGSDGPLRRTATPRPLAGKNPRALRPNTGHVDAERNAKARGLHPGPAPREGLHHANRRHPAARAVCAVAAQLAARASIFERLLIDGPPLADWRTADRPLDDRILAGDAAALHDSIAEALEVLERVRLEIDRRLTAPAAAITTGDRGERVRELARRAFTGRDLHPGAC